MKRAHDLQLPVLENSSFFRFEYQDGIFSNDEKYLIVEKLQDFLYSSLHSMDLKTGEIIEEFRLNCHDVFSLKSFEISEDGTQLVAGGASFTISMDWDPIGESAFFQRWDLQSRTSLGRCWASNLLSIREPVFVFFFQNGEEIIAYNDRELGIIKAQDFKPETTFMKLAVI